MKKIPLFSIVFPLFFTLGIHSQTLFAQITFHKSFGGSTDDYGYFVEQTTDGGYIFAGRSLSFGIAQYDNYLVKTDAFGDTLWTRTFGNTLYEEAYCIQQTNDGGYIMAGQTGSAGDF